MSYIVLARRLRPKSFDDIVGHKTVVKALACAIDDNKIHHAFLLTGTRGVGKTTLARIIAKSINCSEGPRSNPCGICSNCEKIDLGCHEDVIEVDAASRTKVEDTRELIDNAGFSPITSRYKIYIIDEVHMLSVHSFNAILKTVEEPPGHVIFIFATTDPKKLPVTLISRCLRVHLHPLSSSEIHTYLISVLENEGIKYDDGAIRSLSEYAQGSMRDALSLLEAMLPLARKEGLNNTIVHQYLGIPEQGLVIELLDAILMMNKDRLPKLWSSVESSGISRIAIVTEMQKVLFNIAVSFESIDLNLPGYNQDEVRRLMAATDVETVHMLYQLLQKSLPDMNNTHDIKTYFEMLTLRLMTFSNVMTLENTTSTIASNSKISSPKTKLAHAPERSPESNTVVSSPLDNSGYKGGSSFTPQKSTSSNKPTLSYSADKVDKSTSRDESCSGGADWARLVKKLPLSGLAKILALNCEVSLWQEPNINLVLSKEQSPLLNSRQEAKLKEVLQKHLCWNVLNLEIVIAGEKPLSHTPAIQDEIKKGEDINKLEKELSDDPELMKILRRGGAIDKVKLHE